MSYSQNLEGCYKGIENQSGFNSLITSSCLQTFKKAYTEGGLAPISLVEQTDDIQAYERAVQPFRSFEDVLILGTGGSSLGGKTLYSLSTQDKPRLHFLDNVDPSTFSSLFNKLDKTKTGIIAISKSGTTVETLMQLLVCLENFGDNTQVLVITEPKQTPLRKIVETRGWACLDHPTNVGGRYSCFSVVGLVPMILAGLDPYAFRKGALSVLQETLTSDIPKALEGAAMAVQLASQKKTLSVMMPYADQLEYFCLWFCQLWAESLGKEGKGTTPIKALGTVDQHSQLQLYLDGPKDKYFTLLTTHWEGIGTPVKSRLVPEFTEKTMGDLFAAEQRATLETLLRNNCPTRLITVDKIDEYHLGALMMHFMIETILSSYLLGVNAFDQPAVEEGKRLAREYLAA